MNVMIPVRKLSRKIWIGGVSEERAKGNCSRQKRGLREAVTGASGRIVVRSAGAGR